MVPTNLCIWFLKRMLLKEYLANYEIKDRREANLLPSFCVDSDSSCDSSTEESSDDRNDTNSNKTSSHQSKERQLTLKVKSSKWTTYWDLYKRFIYSPRVHFVYDALFYIIFLIMFSYLVLCEFSFYEMISVEESLMTVNKTLTNISSSTNTSMSNLNQTFTTTKSIVKQKVVKLPSNIEYMLIFWIFSFTMEEVRQVGQKKIILKTWNRFK